MNTPVSSTAIPRTVWALGFVSLLMDISSEMIHSLLPLFMVGTLGASALWVGLLEGLAEATALVVKVFSGGLSDYWGRRKPLAVLGYAMGALSKPLFAWAPNPGWVMFARLADRVGKGIRGAPRDALVADVTPLHLRGAAYGLRQSLDTVGAFTGPLLAVLLMWAWQEDIRAIFWIAVVPGVLSVVVLMWGVQEPAERQRSATRINPFQKAQFQRLTVNYWWIVTLGALLMLARFSEAFLVLKAHDLGLAAMWIPLVLVGMNAVYSLVAYPVGVLSDRLGGRGLLLASVCVLALGDVILALDLGAMGLAAGVALWGLHMGMSQGILATWVANSAPGELRGTAFGVFNLISGLALLIASVVAGAVWDIWGSSATFALGGIFCVIWGMVFVKVRSKII